MGFFDSMKKSFDTENQKSAKRQASSSYRTVVQRESAYYNELVCQRDSELLSKYNSPITSVVDKKIIASILESRGYEKHNNGTYGRR